MELADSTMGTGSGLCHAFLHVPAELGGDTLVAQAGDGKQERDRVHGS